MRLHYIVVNQISFLYFYPNDINSYPYWWFSNFSSSFPLSSFSNWDRWEHVMITIGSGLTVKITFILKKSYHRISMVKLQVTPLLLARELHTHLSSVSLLRVNDDLFPLPYCSSTCSLFLTILPFPSRKRKPRLSTHLARKSPDLVILVLPLHGGLVAFIIGSSLFSRAPSFVTRMERCFPQKKLYPFTNSANPLF